MNTLSGYPYFEIQFTKDGKVFNNEEVLWMHKAITSENITDLLVVSHGWNNDMDDARALYKNLVSVIANQQSAQAVTNKRFGVLAVLWPSKKFAEKDLIAGGAAGLDAAAPTDDHQQLLSQLDELKDFFDNDNANEILSKAKLAVHNMEKGAEGEEEFVEALNKLMTTSVEKHEQHADEDGIATFEQSNPKDLLATLEDDSTAMPDINTGGAASVGSMGSFEDSGGAAGIGSAIGNIFSGAKNLLNFVTYYQMKERAGKVGSLGLNPVLVQLRKDFPALKQHLIGHSFGGRLVTAAIAGAGTYNLEVDSLTLLQSAFSHYSFAEKYDGVKSGFFRRVVKDGKVKGPILITYTQKDQAVGLAYALASRIARQVGARIGDKNDFYGGMGGNGAQFTPEADNSIRLNPNSNYNFRNKVVYNLNGDDVITGHCDICKKEVARAIISVVKSTA